MRLGWPTSSTQRPRRRFRGASIALIALLPGLASAQPAVPHAPSVSVVTVGTGSIAETVVVTGTLVPREEVLVSPQLDALAITEVLAEEGDRVTANQVLARLSRDVLDATIAQNAAQAARADAAVAQARSTIAENQANRVQVDQALARTRELLANGNASRETFEQRQASASMIAARTEASQNALRAAEADLALARAQAVELQVRLARTNVRTPVAGVVSRRTARLGSVVAGAAEPLFRIIQDGAIELEADVPELQLTKLRSGQHARVETASGRRDGTVRLVSPEVSRITRLGRVRVAVEGNDGLVIGSFARAVVETARRQAVLAPLSAILFQPGGPVVQVVRDGVVETRPVQVGLRDGLQAEIAQGLAAGDSVMSVSGTFVRNGDRVTPVDVAGARR